MVETFSVSGMAGARRRPLAVGGEGDEMLLPGVQPAILVDGALELVIARGAIEIMGEIVFPRPVSA